ncbi:hypothetical protein chiPu_0026034 [Chiloscyllium punctatum]|uniref:Uncharacterized protein n=1 Tax=Chiloscyllium punctatum TaxID=137246 RepID=A0A401TID2_CHIPU|nr:hypothetical protein [Chiloscyllium punctatum]
MSEIREKLCEPLCLTHVPLHSFPRVAKGWRVGSQAEDADRGRKKHLYRMRMASPLLSLRWKGKNQAENAEQWRKYPRSGITRYDACVSQPTPHRLWEPSASGDTRCTSVSPFSPPADVDLSGVGPSVAGKCRVPGPWAGVTAVGRWSVPAPLHAG